MVIDPMAGPDPEPAIPGVTPELKTAVAVELCGTVEVHADSSRTAPESATRDRRDTTGTSVVVGFGRVYTPSPTDTAAGYTPQAG